MRLCIEIRTFLIFLDIMDMNSANSIEPAPVVSASLNIASNFSGFKVGKPVLKLAP